MTRSEIAKLIAYLGYTWPSFRPPGDEAGLRAMIEVWHRHLGDLDAGVVTATLDALAADGGAFAPGPGQVRAAVCDTAAGCDVDAAWAEVRANIAAVGWTTALGAELSWSDPAAAAGGVVEAGEVGPVGDLVGGGAQRLPPHGRRRDRRGGLAPAVADAIAGVGRLEAAEA